jgi:hypothetical protein
VKKHCVYQIHPPTPDHPDNKPYFVGFQLLRHGKTRYFILTHFKRRLKMVFDGTLQLETACFLLHLTIVVFITIVT